MKSTSILAAGAFLLAAASLTGCATQAPDTLSGRPEAVIAGRTADEVRAALAKHMGEEGFAVVSESPETLVLSRKLPGNPDRALGASEESVTFMLAANDRAVRVVADPVITGMPGAPDEDLRSDSQARLEAQIQRTLNLTAGDIEVLHRSVLQPWEIAVAPVTAVGASPSTEAGASLAVVPPTASPVIEDEMETTLELAGGPPVEAHVVAAAESLAAPAPPEALASPAAQLEPTQAASATAADLDQGEGEPGASSVVIPSQRITYRRYRKAP